MDAQTKTYLQAIEALRRELPDLLPEAEAARLEAELARALENEPEAAVTLALEAITDYPAARERLRALLLPLEEMMMGKGDFEPLPGTDAVPSGPLMVCPEDPSHRKCYLQQRGQVLFCPEHGVKLVPESEVEGNGSEESHSGVQ